MHQLASMSTSETSSSRFVIVVGIDGSSGADRVLDEAAASARTIAGAELHLVHAIEPYAPAVAEVSDHRRGRTHLGEKEKRALAKSGVPVTGHLHASPPAAAIVKIAASIEADLVIVGTRDRRKGARWEAGSVAEHVTRYAGCPVLVVPTHARGRD
jgi:nucleotide-binding universal stress UspA family protein